LKTSAKEKKHPPRTAATGDSASSEEYHAYAPEALEFLLG
jgi:hypothetical protein